MLFTYDEIGLWCVAISRYRKWHTSMWMTSFHPVLWSGLLIRLCVVIVRISYLQILQGKKPKKRKKMQRKVLVVVVVVGNYNDKLYQL